MIWDIGDLAPGETARAMILVSTDYNLGGGKGPHQEYTEPGIYEFNSGATLKFLRPDYDPEDEGPLDPYDIQLSAYTDSISVTVLEED